MLCAPYSNPYAQFEPAIRKVANEHDFSIRVPVAKRFEQSP